MSAEPEYRLHRARFRAMASLCEISVDGAMPEAEAQAAMRAAAVEVKRIETKYSRYRTDDASIVHRINSSAGTGEWIACDNETEALLRAADTFHKMSGGLFDITSGVLRQAWDFRVARLPSANELAPLLALIGWDKVERRDGAIRLPLAGMEIDLGGIGKEYAADCAAGVLMRSGIKHGYVNLGGDIRVAGPAPGGEAWHFGVADPRGLESPVAAIALSSGGLSTSGDYEKFFEIDGVRHCHILNPMTGMSAQCWRSVSVTAVTSLAAGAMTTIAMLKEADAVPFLDSMKCSYLLIGHDGRTITNSIMGAP